MAFQNTEERRMLGETLHKTLGAQYGIGVRNAIAYTSPGWSQDYWALLRDIGAVEALFTPERGGLAGEGFDIAVVFEQLGRHLVVEPLLGNLMVGQALVALGADEAVTGPVVNGERKAALAWEEADGRSDPAWVTTAARTSGSAWVLDGQKTAIRHGAAVDWLLVSARTAGRAGDQQGLTMFGVPVETPGVVVRDFGTIDGGRIAEVSLHSVHLPGDALVGLPGKGWAGLEAGIGAGLLALSAEAAGAMGTVLESTVEYLRARQQFDRPLAAFQALQHRVANLFVEVEQARSAVVNAARHFESTDRGKRESALSAAKYLAGSVGNLVAEDGIQLHGGMGMTWELPLSHFAKRLVMIDHQLGDADYHLARYTHQLTVSRE